MTLDDTWSRTRFSTTMFHFGLHLGGKLCQWWVIPLPVQPLEPYLCDEDGERRDTFDKVSAIQSLI